MRGIVEIAIGNRNDGLPILESYLRECKANQVNDPSENMRRKNARKQAQEIYEDITMAKNEYI